MTKTKSDADKIFDQIMNIDQEMRRIERHQVFAMDCGCTGLADRCRRMLARRDEKRARLAAEWNALQPR